MKRISNYIKSYCTFPGVHIRLKMDFFHLSKPVTCIINLFATKLTDKYMKMIAHV